MIRGILFDLDETLLDRSTSLRSFLHDQYARCGEHIQVPFAQFQARFVELDERGYVHKSIVYSKLLEESIIKGLTSEQLLHDYRTNFAKHAQAFPGMHEALTALRATCKLGIVTNGETLFQQQNIEAIGLPEQMDTILISEREQLRKPDPRIFHLAAERLGLSPNECLFIGDHPQNDIAGAKHAGMSTAWFPNGIPWPDKLPLPDLKIHDLRELPKLLQ